MHKDQYAVYFLGMCCYKIGMLYNFELQMAGIILFSAMIAGGVAMWYRRRRALSEGEDGVQDTSDNLR